MIGKVESAPKLNLTKSMAMLEDAQRLTPGGVGGIRRPYNFVVGEYPVFITHGQGGHIFDVDGNEYIDMLCAYGPIILGYVEPEINDAAKAQMDKGFCFSLVQPLQNELEQRLAEHHALRRADHPRQDRLRRHQRGRARDARLHRPRQDRPLRLPRLGRLVRRAPRRRAAGRERPHQGVRVRRPRRPASASSPRTRARSPA